MFISWHGFSSILLEGKGKDAASVLVDPYAPDGKMLRRAGDSTIVATSLSDRLRQELMALPRTKAILGPGEYDVRGVYITVFAVVRAPLVAAASIVMDGIVVLHLGGLSAAPAEQLLEKFEHVDVLTLSVGGGDGMTPKTAAELTRFIEPHVIIPLRYCTNETAKTYEPLSAFLKEMGVSAAPVPLEQRLKIERDAIRELSMRVMVLGGGSL